MSKYQAIFFDAGYTLLYLYPSSGEVVAGVCRELGLDLDPVQANEVLRRHYRGAREEVYLQGNFSTSPERTRDFWYGVYQGALEELGLKDGFHHYCEAILAELQQSKHYRLFPDVYPTLSWLKARGYALGIISNFDPSLVDLLQDLSISGYFDHHFISSLVGVEKPDRRIFEIAIEAVGLPPGALVMVGDDLVADVCGAQAVGMGGILLDRRDRYPKQGGQADGYIRIKDLWELKPLLDSEEVKD